MTYRFQFQGIDFVVELEQIHEPRQSELDDDDWQALTRGEIAVYNLLITSQKGGEKLIHFQPHWPMPISSQERKEELECLVLETPFLESILIQWEMMENSPQDESPPWGDSKK